VGESQAEVDLFMPNIHPNDDLLQNRGQVHGFMRISKQEKKKKKNGEVMQGQMREFMQKKKKARINPTEISEKKGIKKSLCSIKKARACMCVRPRDECG